MKNNILFTLIAITLLLASGCSKENPPTSDVLGIVTELAKERNAEITKSDPNDGRTSYAFEITTSTMADAMGFREALERTPGLEDYEFEFALPKVEKVRDRCVLDFVVTPPG